MPKGTWAGRNEFVCWNVGPIKPVALWIRISSPIGSRFVQQPLRRVLMSLTPHRRVEVCWVLPGVLTDMRGRCLYLGLHPGSVLNGRRPLWGFNLPHEPEYWGSPHNCVRRSASHNPYYRGGPNSVGLSQRLYVMYLYTLKLNLYIYVCASEGWQWSKVLWCTNMLL